MTHEFYAPFFHVPGVYEWAQIHTTTHGSFLCFILITSTTSDPVVVYVCTENGERFMADRFPESKTVRIDDGLLTLTADPDGARAHGTLRAEAGPIRAAEMAFTAESGKLPRAVPYGNGQFAVWGSNYRCEGIDLNRTARVNGRVVFAEQPDHALEDEAGVITVGSYGRLWEA